MTFAVLARRSAIQQAVNSNKFNFSLATSSVQTTKKYLACQQRLRNAVNDQVGIGPLQ
jgi:hypothetical protein